jgi:hypothetical protein
MFAALALAGALAACQDAAGPAHERETVQQRHSEEGFRTRGETRTGWIFNRSGQPSEVRYEVQGKLAIVEGDIIIGEAESIAPTREVLLSRLGGRGNIFRESLAYRWPGGVVPYVIAGNVPNQWRVTDAMAHISANNPMVQFVPRTTQPDYIVVQQSTGCASSVGRIGGAQAIQLADACSTGNTIHELLHALGMHHEQSRCDRDMYVQVNQGNIDPQAAYNFAKQCGTGYMGTTWDYDEGSIMHYGAYAFSINGLPTIQSLRNRAIGQRSGMSVLDVSGVEYMYPSSPPPLSVYVSGPTDVQSSSNCHLMYQASVSGGAGGESYSWFIDGMNTGETGSYIWVSGFSPGGHTVQVNVSDASGAQSSGILEVSSSSSGTDC